MMAAAMAGPRSSATRTGPKTHCTAGIRVSRSIGSRMPATSWCQIVEQTQVIGDQLGQRASAGRFERRHPVELNCRTRLGVALEAEVDVGCEVIGGSCLSNSVGLVERHHGCPTKAQFTRKCPGQSAETAILSNHDAALGDRPEARAQPVALAYSGDPGAGTALRAHHGQGPHRVGPADAVGRRAAVRLELLQRPRRAGSENAIDAPAVEAEPAEPRLQLGDVVAAQVR